MLTDLDGSTGLRSGLAPFATRLGQAFESNHRRGPASTGANCSAALSGGRLSARRTLIQRTHSITKRSGVSRLVLFYPGICSLGEASSRFKQLDLVWLIWPAFSPMSALKAHRCRGRELCAAARSNFGQALTVSSYALGECGWRAALFIWWWEDVHELII